MYICKHNDVMLNFKDERVLTFGDFCFRAIRVGKTNRKELL